MEQLSVFQERLRFTEGENNMVTLIFTQLVTSSTYIYLTSSNATSFYTQRF